MRVSQAKRANPSAFIFRVSATLFYIGYIPFAPGTFGTLFGAFILYLFRPPLIPYLILFFLVLVWGTISSGKAEKELGRDAGPIVIDELAGYLMSMFLLPLSAGFLTGAFILFRLFDILKPPPIKYLDRPGGLGIMADDIAAGILTNILLQLWRVFI